MCSSLSFRFDKSLSVVILRKLDTLRARSRSLRMICMRTVETLWALLLRRSTRHLEF